MTDIKRTLITECFRHAPRPGQRARHNWAALSCAQAYDEQRRRRDAEREAKELAEEEEAERLAAEKQAREDAEAAKWMGQIAVEQQGEEAQSEEQAQVSLPHSTCQDLCLLTGAVAWLF